MKAVGSHVLLMDTVLSLLGVLRGDSQLPRQGKYSKCRGPSSRPVSVSLAPLCAVCLSLQEVPGDRTTVLLLTSIWLLGAPALPSQHTPERRSCELLPLLASAL